MERRKRPWSVEFTKGTKKQIKEAQQHRCAVCGAEACLEVHHRIPVAMGGTRDPDNGIGVCPPCHKCLDRAVLNLRERGNKVVMVANVIYLLAQRST